LQNGDLKGFGQLMNESHCSLRDDYEVSGKELDALVEAAWLQEGVIGSRMTGAGFGGCTISIVQKAQVDRFIEQVRDTYYEKTSLEAEFYVVTVGEGARELTLEAV
jgi:galactokinase